MTTLTQVVMATYASSSDSVPFWLLALGPAGAVGVYWALFRHYRNTDKSHAYERETLITAQPVQGNDHKVDEVHGTQRSSVEHDNSGDHRRRVTRLR